MSHKLNSIYIITFTITIDVERKKKRKSRAQRRRGNETRAIMKENHVGVMM